MRIRSNSQQKKSTTQLKQMKQLNVKQKCIYNKIIRCLHFCHSWEYVYNLTYVQNVYNLTEIVKLYLHKTEIVLKVSMRELHKHLLNYVHMTMILGKKC